MTDPAPPHSLHSPVVLSPAVAQAIEQAAVILERGGVVAYPSETVWGLAAHPQRPEGVALLYELKGRSVHKPVQVSCAKAHLALALAQPNPALLVLSGLWPGPLTVVTPASALCPPALAPDGQVGLRVPDHPVALALLARCGGALATTSCNRAGAAPALTQAQASATGLAELTLPDGGFPARGQASTVVRLPGGQLLREGEISAVTIRALLEAAP